MNYTRTTEEKVKKEIQDAIKNGAKVIDLSIFDGLDKLNLEDRTINEAEFSIDIYREYVKHILELNEIQKERFLKTLKNADVIDNQLIEKENSFLISFYRSSHSRSAIDELINHYGKEFTKEEFVKYHDILLKGTSSEDKSGLRTNNYKFVGSIENGIRSIQYFPILYENIPEALNTLLSYYNANINKVDKEYDIFIRPIVYHGLIAALQLFQDGNTRYARLFQNVEIWGLANNILEGNINLPAAYPTKQYFSVREDYRKLIKNIVLENTSDAWNEWIKFNLRIIQNSIWLNEENINTLKLRMK